MRLLVKFMSGNTQAKSRSNAGRAKRASITIPTLRDIWKIVARPPIWKYYRLTNAPRAVKCSSIKRASALITSSSTRETKSIAPTAAGSSPRTRIWSGTNPNVPPQGNRVGIESNVDCTSVNAADGTLARKKPWKRTWETCTICFPVMSANGLKWRLRRKGEEEDEKLKGKSPALTKNQSS